MKTKLKSRGIIFLISLLLALTVFSLAACGEDTIGVESVTLNKTQATLTVGEEMTLTATVTPDNVSDKSVKWKSSDATIATVTNLGVVKGIKAGKVDITVTTVDGDKQAKCEVTVALKTFTATFKNGETTVGTVEFKEGDTALDAPSLTATATDGYAMAWENFTLGDSNITINAVAGNGSAAKPFLIAKAEHFEQLLTDSRVDGKTVGKSYKLLADISMEDIEGSDLSGGTFGGIFDGNGKALTALDGARFLGNYGAMFEYSSGKNNITDTITFKDLTLKLKGNISTMVGITYGVKTSFVNVDVYNDNDYPVELTADDNNESPYVHLAFATETEFVDCNVYADFVSASAYNGVFVGGYPLNDSTLTFKNSTYEGDYYSVGKVGMLVGNPSQKAATINIDAATKLNGTITAAVANIYVGLSNAKIDAVEAAKYNATNVGQDGSLDVVTNKKYAVDATGDITVTKGTEASLMTGKYELVLSAYVSITKQDVNMGTVFMNLQFVEQHTEGESVAFDAKQYTFQDKATYLAAHVDSTLVYDKTLQGYNIKYGIDTTNNIVVFDYTDYANEGEVFTLNQKAGIRVFVRDTDNKLQAYLVK